MKTAQYKIIYYRKYFNDPFPYREIFFSEQIAFKIAKIIINYSWVHRMELWKNDSRLLLVIK